MSDEKRPLIARRASIRNERSLYHRRVSCVLILLAELLERLAFYATSFNLVMFLNQKPFQWTTIQASNAEFTLSALAFGFCFVSGYLADAKVGRFRTIVIFYIILLLGYGSLLLTDPHKYNIFCNINMTGLIWTNMTPADHRLGNWTPFVTPVNTDNDAPCQPAVYMSLVLIGLGTASVRTNIAPFGADQVRAEGPESMRMFFNWLYWSINLGTLLAIFGVTYMEQEVGFLKGFATVLGVIFVSLIIFLSGTRSYVRRPAPGTRPLRYMFGVINDAIRNKRRPKPVIINTPVPPENTVYPALPRCPIAVNESQPASLLDYAMLRHGGKFSEHYVEDTKFFFKIILIFASFVPYWTVYFQMTTTYLLQGLHMRITPNCSSEIPVHDPNSFRIPPVWLSAFDMASTIIFIPIVDRFIYRALDKRGYPLSLRTRIAIGMVFTILSVLCAGLVERYRLQVYWDGNVENPCVQTIGGSPYYAANISIFYQTPQYALIGISEIFTSIAGMELAYAAAPKNMQGITMGLFLLFSGIGAMIGVGTMNAFHWVWFFDWDYGNINCRFACHDNRHKVCMACHLDYYFYFLAGLQALGLILFLTFSHVLRIGYGCPCSEANLTRSVNGRLDSETRSGDPNP